MKVKDLIAELSKHDQNLDVLCYTEDSTFLQPGHTFRLLEVVDVSESEGEKQRGDDDVPTLKLGKSHYSERFTIIEVTSDF